MHALDFEEDVVCDDPVGYSSISLLLPERVAAGKVHVNLLPTYSSDAKIRALPMMSVHERPEEVRRADMRSNVTSVVN
jgi:hypothetical protein